MISLVERSTPLLLRHGPEEGDGPVRGLLLHGMANSAAVWDRFRAADRSGTTWTAADLPWRGDGVGDWSHEPDPVRWVDEAIARTVAERGPLDVVVAHSFSAVLLLDLLTRTETAAARLGLRAVVFLAPFYRPRPEMFDWDTMAGLADQFLRTMEEGIRVIGGGRSSDPARRRHMAQRVCERVGPYGWTRFFDQYLRTPWTPTERVTVPSMVVSGTEDGIAAPEESAALAERLPGGRLVQLPGCGHFPMVERTDDLTGVLTEFIAPLRAPTALEISR